MLHRRALVPGLLAAAFARPAAAQIAFGGAAPPPPLTDRPRWLRNAIPAPRRDGRPAITLVVDDMGVIHPGTARVMALPGPLTLAWFPFARGLPAQIAEANGRGHEAVMHMPMQAHSNSIAWTGPDPLRVDLSPEENLHRLKVALDAVPDTVGLNNHMGSVASLDPSLMAMVADECKRRGMLVLDSVTVPHSQVYPQAVLAGVPAAARDVFVDPVANADVIRAQLAQIETIARVYGHAIAIGHPWPLTIEALEAWVPTLESRGFALWPLSATVAWRNQITIAS
jgi:polysaccharide deacetylase 2 family uncharacterized protein YibQ